MKSVLFICNGNIFRSMSAEYALRAQIDREDAKRVASAGITANPQEMLAPVRERLIERGIDPSGHHQRRLTREILEDADIAIAMSLDHQAHVAEHFGRQIPLFNRVCFGRDDPLLDIGEHFPNWKEVPDEVNAYAIKMVDTIWDAIPSLIRNLPDYER